MRITGISGPAARAGVLPGDELLSVSGHAVRDVLDYRFYTYDRELTLLLRGADGAVREARLRHSEGGDIGLSFESFLMDSERACRNRCVFCFIDQNPPGCRESLYFKDDDARLSFLMGNYITLTNVSDDELERLIRMRISPLGLSVHTTDPELRVRMLANPRAAGCMDAMRRLAAGGIEMNCQIVLCPGYNDGEALVSTLADLRAFGEAVRSVSVVPVGLTAHRDGLTPLSPVTAAGARDAIEAASRFENVWCSDEMYLLAGLPIPPAEFYGDFPQLENGVGMTALFESEWNSGEPAKADFPQTVATGLAAASFFERLLSGLPVNTVAVENRFFGGMVDVAGLLSGGDLLKGLSGRALGARVLIPSNTLRHGTDVFLDDMTVPGLSKSLGVPVIPVFPSADALKTALEEPLQCL